MKLASNSLAGHQLARPGNKLWADRENTLSEKLMDLNCGNSRKCTRGKAWHPEAAKGMNIHIPTNTAFAANVMELLPDGTITLEVVLSRLSADASLSVNRRRDLMSAVRLVARALGEPPSHVPADAKLIRRRLSKLPPEQGRARKTRANILAGAAAAFAHVGVTAKRSRLLPLSTEWQLLWEELPQRLKLVT